MMMPVRVRYLLTCEKVILNEDKSVDFKKVFEKKELKEIPSTLDISLVVSLEFMRDKEINKKVLVRMLDSKNESMVKDLYIEQPEQKEFDDDKKAIVILNDIQLPNFPVKQEGFYTFLVIYGEEVIGSLKILLVEEVKR